MKNLLKRELLLYRIHPLFYITAIIFTAFCPFLFFINQQFFISGIGSTDLHHFFSAVPYICILILPALALHADNSSAMLPFSSLQIVAAKLLAAVIAFCVMLLPLILVPLFVSFFGDIQIGLVIIGFICILLYAAAAVSMCIFVSLAIKNTALSYIVCALILAAINSIHFLPLYFQFPGIVTKFIRGISFAWHFDAAGKGIFDTRDVFFYILITCVFVFLSVFLMEKQKGKNLFCTGDIYRSLTVVFIFGSLLLGLADSAHYHLRWDLTSAKQFTVSDFGKKLTEDLDTPLRFTYYRSNELTRLYPSVRDVSDFLIEYTAVHNNITFEIKDPSKMKNPHDLENYGIMSQQLKSASGNKTEYIDVYSAVLIEYLDKYEVIPFVLSTDMLEYDIDSRVQHLVKNVTRTAAVICGNELSLDSDYNYVIPWLESQGFVCTKLYLPSKIQKNKTAKPEKKLEEQISQLDRNTVLVVIGSDEINGSEAAAIENFAAGGGSIFFAVSPYKIDISGDWSITRVQNEKIVPLISHWGIEIDAKLVGDISNNLVTMYASDENGTKTTKSHAVQINYPLWLSILPQRYARSGMTLYWASPLTLYGDEGKEKINPVLVTSNAAWLIQETKETPSRLYETNPFLLKNSIPESKECYTIGAEIEGTVPLYYNAGRSESTKIMVIPDQYFLNTLMMGYTSGKNGDFRNLDFLVNALLVLRGDKELVSIRNRGQKNDALYKITDAKQFFRIEKITLLSTLIIVPLLFVLCGILSAIRRRKGNKHFAERINDPTARIEKEKRSSDET